MNVEYIFLLTILIWSVVLMKVNPVTSSNTGAVSEGIFERFLSNLFNLLTSPAFPDKKLKKLCGIFHRETDRIKNTYGRKLAKRFRRMSRMHSDEVKEEVQEYQRIYVKKLPARTEFLKAMNDVFTLRENLLFEDYIYDLRDYGNHDKLLVDNETRKVIHEVIMKSIHEMGARDQIDLLKKLKEAIKEYKNDEVDLDFLSMFQLKSEEMFKYQKDRS